MKESTTYQAILEEGAALGEAREARKILLRQGSKRFGSPDAKIRATIEAITSLDRLKQLAERLLEVETREELLRRE